MGHPRSRRNRSRRRFILSRQAARQTAATPAVIGPDAREVANTRQFLRESLLGQRPVTWVITGEHVSGKGGVTLAGRFGARVLRDWQRSEDEIMRTTRRGDRLRSLCDDLEQRILRYDPVAAVLVVRELTDAEAADELAALDDILTRLSAASVAAVVLPPTPSGAGESLTLDPAAEAFHRDITRTAAAHAAVVVPTVECHRPSQLSAALFAALGLDRPRPTPAEAILQQRITVGV